MRAIAVIACIGAPAACGDDEAATDAETSPDAPDAPDASDTTDAADTGGPDGDDGADDTDPPDDAAPDTLPEEVDTTPTDPCEDDPCGPGTCTDDGAGAYRCACPSGTFDDGVTCAACGAVDGCDRVSCTAADDAACDACADGYEDDGAGGCADIDDCAGNPCGDGVCTDNGANDYTCVCDLGFFVDGGTCVACAAIERCAEVSCTRDDDAVCESCEPGWVVADGACAPLEEGPCDLSPCGEGACVDNGDGTYGCDCPDGTFEGEGTCSACPAFEGCQDVRCVSAEEVWCERCADGYVDDGVGGCAEPGPACAASGMGTCNGADEVSWCVVAPAGIVLSLEATSPCLAGEECRDVDGVSRCYPALDSAECTRAMAFCDGDTLVACEEAGPFTRTACADGCVSRLQGAYCADATPVTTFEATITYDYKLVNDALSDWEAEPRSAPLRGAIVHSYRKVGDAQVLFDTAVTDMAGHFAIRVADPPSADDVVSVYAARNRPLSSALSMVIAEPALPDGEQPINSVASGEPYRWDLSPSEMASGDEVHITEAQGAGAMRVFDVMSVVYENTAELYYRELEPQSVVVWLRIGTTWSCGECLWGQASEALGAPLDTQMFIPGDPTDASYWADAVTLHEAGHWVMGAFGRSPGEGGPHTFGVAYYPGLAWSEGFATWLSSDWRNNTRYLDKQGGSVFWLDIGSREASGNTPWPRPVPEDGVAGRIYENEVAAIVWRLSTNPDVTANEIYFALNSARAKEPLREYTRHTWKTDPSTGEPTDVVDTGEPAVMLADFLDALMCTTTVAGMGAHVDAATEPDTHYAYPSASPICE